MHTGWHHGEMVLEKLWDLMYDSFKSMLGVTGIGLDQVGKNEHRKEDFRVTMTWSLYFGEC